MKKKAFRDTSSGTHLKTSSYDKTTEDHATLNEMSCAATIACVTNYKRY